MKAIIEKVLECLVAFLPFLFKRGKKKWRELKSSANWSENSMRSWSGSWRKCCRIISGCIRGSKKCIPKYSR